MYQRMGSSLVQVMACHGLGTKHLPKPSIYQLKTIQTAGNMNNQVLIKYNNSNVLYNVSFK